MMSFKRQGTYRFGEFEVDLAHRWLRRGEHAVAISRETFDLLAFLVAHPQRLLTQDELVSALWPNAEVEESNLSQHMFLLRRALTGAEPGDAIIVTIPGRGYEFAAPVTVVPTPQDASDELHLLSPAQSEARLPRKQRSMLDEAKGGSAPAPDGEPRALSALRPSVSWRRILAVTALLVVAALGWLIWRHQRAPRAESVHLVLGDLQNATGNQELDQSLKEALAIDLRQSPYLNVDTDEAAQTVPAQASAPALAENRRSACGRSGAQAFVTGEVHRVALKYLVSVQALDCRDNRSVAAIRGIADSPDNLLRVLHKVAADLRAQLGEPHASLQRFNKPVFPPDTGSLIALKAYADATQLAAQGKYSDAIALFERAVAIDPQFVHAYEGLGLAYSNLGQRDAATNDLTHAYQLRDIVSDYDRFSIVARYSYLVAGDLQASLRNFKEAIDLYPHSPVFLVGLADLENRIGKPAQALDPAHRALALDRANAAAYEVLAGAQMRLGQFEEAANICRRPVNRQIDTAQLHVFLLQIAYLRLDQQGIDEQIAWAKGKPAEPEMLLQQGLMDMAQGKVKAAQPAFAAAVDGYRKQGQTEVASRIQAAMPRREAELGLTDLAYTQLGRQSAAGDSADIAIAWAETGETSRAQAMLQRTLDENPSATLWQQMFSPQIRAAIALNEHQAQAAIQALEPAQPYDMAGFDVPGMRGRAYLAAGQPEQAEAEFHKILDHPGIEPLSQNYPLAQLGLARALAREGKAVEASFAYKVVLQIWKEADPDLPRLREAKAEYARLSGEPVSSSPKPRRE